MRVLIIHQEAEYFAGAEKMLAYFLDELAGQPHEITVAAVRQSRVPEIIPKGVQTIWLPANSRFSPLVLGRQTLRLHHSHKAQPFDVIHGWAVRNWELTSLAARLAGHPGVGTLHDHPQAPFLSPSRRRMMAWSARFGLKRIACVSDALRQECIRSQYPPDKLRVVHNGLPLLSGAVPHRPRSPFQLAFLGMFSERKGLRGLFEMLDLLAKQSTVPWEMNLAGDAQNEEGRVLVAELTAKYQASPWWPKIKWLGWVKSPRDFLASVDLLICPSSEFDPFPTVLLEAGQAGLATLAAGVGGVPEIVQDGMTGWVFEPRNWLQAARKLAEVLASPGLLQDAGRQAKKRVEQEFPIARMASDYLSLYANVVHS